MAWSLQDDEAIDWFCPGTTGHTTDGGGEKHKLPTSGGKLPMVSNPKAAEAIGQVATTTGSKPEVEKSSKYLLPAETETAHFKTQLKRKRTCIFVQAGSPSDILTVCNMFP